MPGVKNTTINTNTKGQHQHQHQQTHTAKLWCEWELTLSSSKPSEQTQAKERDGRRNRSKKGERVLNNRPREATRGYDSPEHSPLGWIGWEVCVNQRG